jgi:hypothetical protein
MEPSDSIAVVTGASAFRQPGGRHPRDRSPERPPSRELTVTSPPAEVLRPVATRVGGFVPFLAHLVATRDKAPQLRERRRAEPFAVAACYAASSRGAPQPRPRFNRSA